MVEGNNRGKHLAEIRKKLDEMGDIIDDALESLRIDYKEIKEAMDDLDKGKKRREVDDSFDENEVERESEEETKEREKDKKIERKKDRELKN